MKNKKSPLLVKSVIFIIVFSILYYIFYGELFCGSIFNVPGDEITLSDLVKTLPIFIIFGFCLGIITGGKIIKRIASDLLDHAIREKAEIKNDDHRLMAMIKVIMYILICFLLLIASYGWLSSPVDGLKLLSGSYYGLNELEGGHGFNKGFLSEKVIASFFFGLFMGINIVNGSFINNFEVIVHDQSKSEKLPSI